MKLVDLQNPIALAKIIANSNANSIPVNATGTSYASQIEGFPAVTMIPEEQGGEAPHGLDFNGFLKMLSSHVFNIQNGTPETFNPSVSSLIGGYPKNAQLWLIDDNNSRYLKSTKDDNTDNFLTNPSVIGTSWVDAFPTKDYVDNADRDLQAQITTNANNIATKANNNAVVHIAGTETITGAKTFTSGYKSNISVMYNDNITKGTAPSSNSQYINMYMVGDSRTSGDSNALGLFRTYVTTSNIVYSTMQAFKNVASSGASSALRTYYNTAQNKFGVELQALSTGTDTNESMSLSTNATDSTRIPTMGWVNNPAASTNVVHRSGNETIAGNKTFSGATTFTEDVNITGDASVHVTRTVSGLDYSGFLVQNTSLTKGTAPSTSCGGQWLFQAKDGINEANRIGGVFSRVRASGETTNPGAYETVIAAYKPEASSTTNADIRIIYPTSGSPYAKAPASNIDGSILTTSSHGSVSGKGRYIKLGNGLIIQWGDKTTSGSGEQTLEFPLPFTSTNYSVSANFNVAVGRGDSTVPEFFTKSTNSCKFYSQHNFQWIAMGY